MVGAKSGEYHMRGYVGIDIGTTNSKVVAVGESGDILLQDSAATPWTLRQGLRFFDLAAIDSLVDSFVARAADICSVKAVAFSSVGESVVPVKNGRALADPPLWDESAISANGEEAEIMGRHGGFAETGIQPNGLLSLDKILWMRRNLKETREADYWLPLSSYEAYRKTGSTLWDYSQAGRSNLFQVHKRTWLEPMLDAFGLPAPGTLAPMGRPAGERDGIGYALGGHDHIVGLFGIRQLFGAGDLPFFYYSMGTAAVLALAVRETDGDLHGLKAYNPRGGSLIADAEKGAYILTRSFRRFGGLLRSHMKLGGHKAETADFAEVNRQINAENPPLDCLFACDSDFLLGRRKSPQTIWFDAGPDMTIPGLIHSTYVYLCMVSAFIRDDLFPAAPVSAGRYRFVAGGGNTENALLMDYLASAINHEITLPGVREISALGAAVAAICSRDDYPVLEALRSRLKEKAVLRAPSPHLAPLMEEARKRYCALRRRLETLGEE
jgi:sugar (pentulose or hexulose) kinase